MSTQPSQTRIANRALTLMGSSKRILSLGDPSPEAKTMLALFDGARDATLAAHPWNFALARAALPSLSTPPAYGYAFAYQLPADCLRWLPPGRGDRDWYRAEQEGGRLLSDVSAPLRVRYIARVEDVALWSAGFADALAYRLAAEAAEPLTADKGTSDRMMRGWQAQLGAARRQDGAATGDDDAGDDDAQSEWLGARAGFGGRRGGGRSSLNWIG